MNNADQSQNLTVKSGRYPRGLSKREGPFRAGVFDLQRCRPRGGYLIGRLSTRFYGMCKEIFFRRLFKNDIFFKKIHFTAFVSDNGIPVDSELTDNFERRVERRQLSSKILFSAPFREHFGI